MRPYFESREGSVKTFQHIADGQMKAAEEKLHKVVENFKVQLFLSNIRMSCLQYSYF